MGCAQGASEGTGRGENEPSGFSSKVLQLASCSPLCFVDVACSAAGLILQQFCHSSSQLNLLILSAP